jgi:hypothetical protein
VQFVSCFSVLPTISHQEMRCPPALPRFCLLSARYRLADLALGGMPDAPPLAHASALYRPLGHRGRWGLRLGSSTSFGPTSMSTVDERVGSPTRCSGAWGIDAVILERP